MFWAGSVILTVGLVWMGFWATAAIGQPLNSLHEQRGTALLIIAGMLPCLVGVILMVLGR